MLLKMVSGISNATGHCLEERTSFSLVPVVKAAVVGVLAGASILENSITVLDPGAKPNPKKLKMKKKKSLTNTRSSHTTSPLQS